MNLLLKHKTIILVFFIHVELSSVRSRYMGNNAIVKLSYYKCECRISFSGFIIASVISASMFNR